MKNTEKGFSLIELLLVVVIAGLIAAISIPFLFKALGASRNANAYASLRSIASVQISYFSQHNRFARLAELNAVTNNGLGIIDGNTLRRGKFTLTMSPVTPTDSQLRDDYEIVATKSVTISDTPCVLTVDGSGVIREIFGTNCIDND